MPVSMMVPDSLWISRIRLARRASERARAMRAGAAFSHR